VNSEEQIVFLQRARRRVYEGHQRRNLQQINDMRFLIIVTVAELLTVCEIFRVQRLKIAIFAHCIPIVDP